MKNIKYILFTAIILMGLSSCDDWLKVYPENSQVTETFWTITTGTLPSRPSALP